MNEYHNPENVPESAIPKGWQFIPKDLFPLKTEQPCRLWRPTESEFNSSELARGHIEKYTYIIKK